MASYLCHLCLDSVFAKHAVAILAPFAVQQKFTSGIDDLLHVELLPNDGMPQCICEKRKHKLETLQKATHVLKIQGSFCSQASARYETLRRGTM